MKIVHQPNFIIMTAMFAMIALIISTKMLTQQRLRIVYVHMILKCYRILYFVEKKSLNLLNAKLIASCLTFS